MADVKYLIVVDDKGKPKIEAFGNEIGDLKTKSDKATPALKGMFNKIALGAAAAIAARVAIRSMVRLMGDAIQKGREFERGFANVTTMLDTSAVNANDFKRELLSMSPVLGDTTKLARGMYQVLSASIEPAKAVQFLGEAAMSAKAGVTDVATAVDALTTVINAYGMEAESVTEVSDIMFQAVKRGKLTYEQMAQALGTVVPIASAVGIEFNQIAAAMASLTRQGIDANTATMQLRQVLNSIIAPSVEAAKEAGRLGLEFNSTALKAKGLVGFLADVKEKTGGNVESLKALVPNVRALTGVMALAGEQSAAFAYDLELMADASGSTREALEKQMDSLDFWLDAFSVAADKAKISFYDGFAGPVKEALPTIEDLDEATKELTITMREFGKVVGSIVVPAVKVFFDQFQDRLRHIKMAEVLIVGFVEAIKKGQIPTLKNATRAYAEHYIEAQKNHDLIKAVTGAYQDIKAAIKEGMEAQDALMWAWIRATGALGPLNEEVKGLATHTKVANLQLDPMQALMSKLLRQVTQGTLNWADYIAEIRKLEKQQKIIKQGFDDTTLAVEDLDLVIPGVGANFETMSIDIIAALRRISPTIGGLNREMVESMRESTAKVKTLWDTFTDGLQTKWSTEFAKMIELPSKLRDDIAPIFTAIYDTFADMVGNMAAKWLVGFIEPFISNTADAAAKVVGSVDDVVDSALDLAKGFSPGGLIATAIGTAVGTFLAGLISGGPGKRDIQLIKDNTWNTNQNVINLHDANVARLDELKLAAWDRNVILNDIRALIQAGGFGGGGGGSTGSRASGRGARPSITVNPNVNVDVASTPVTLEVDGRVLATVLIPYIERRSTRGRVKFNQVSLVRT